MDGMERRGRYPRLSMLEDPPCYREVDLWVSAKADDDQVIELHTRVGEAFRHMVCQNGRWVGFGGI